MAKQQRSTTRKAKEKWKTKTWFKVLAPDMFGGQEIAETPADEPTKMVGRIVPVSLHELTGDFSKSHIKLTFIINNLRGNEATTVYQGHTLTSDYVRRMTRRKHSKMDGVYDVQTRDGYVVRIKSMAITEKRIQSAQEKLLRKFTGETITKLGSSSTLAELVKAIISGDLAKAIFKACKHIYPIKRVDISKSRILRRVEGAQDIPLEEIKKEVEAAAPAPEGEAPAPVTPAEPAKDERSPEEMLDETPEPKPAA